MPIDINCPECFVPYRLKDEFAGRRIKCKQCGRVIPIPRGGSVPAPDESPWADDGSSNDLSSPPAFPRRSGKSGRRTRHVESGFQLRHSVWTGAAYLGVVLLIGMVGVAWPPILQFLRFGVVQIGMLFALIGSTACLIGAFRESPACGLMWMFVPFYALYYMLSRFAVIGKWVTLWGFGTVATLVGIIFLVALGALPRRNDTSPAGAAPGAERGPSRIDKFLSGTHDDESRRDLNGQAVGAHRFLMAMRTLPPNGNPTHPMQLSWQSCLLLYLNQAAIYNRLNEKVVWNDPVNLPLYRHYVPEYQHAHIAETADEQGLSLSHYAMNQWLIGADGRGLRNRDIQDGLATTFLIGEVGAGYKPWGDPSNLRDLSNGLTPSPDSFGNPTGRGAWLLHVDGSVRWYGANTDPELLRALSTPAGGEPVQF